MKPYHQHFQQLSMGNVSELEMSSEKHFIGFVYIFLDICNYNLYRIVDLFHFLQLI